MVEKIRLSIGTAIQMGLEPGDLDECFSTAFLMTYTDRRCSANCAFCPQARGSNSASDRLSRISWPVYTLDDIMERFSEDTPFKRVCIQVLNSPGITKDVKQIIIQLRDNIQIPISISIHPLSKAEMMRLHAAGATSIGIALDACTEPLFTKIKGKERGSAYRWQTHIEALSNALEVFGEGNVATHLIVGLGESEEEIIEFLKKMKRLKIRVGLFAFTNIRGTALEHWSQPDISTYRRVQVVHYILNNELLSDDKIRIVEGGEVQLDLSTTRLKEILSSGAAFQTSGCKDCNRPYYNERPSGPLYNYPRPLSREEVAEAIAATGLVS
ncbi:MAG: radical SAM protein [Candidatus Thorarchaeota archaeon]